jgi:hypothetical protein
LNAGVVSNFREEEVLAFERAVAAFGEPDISVSDKTLQV